MEVDVRLSEFARAIADSKALRPYLSDEAYQRLALVEYEVLAAMGTPEARTLSWKDRDEEQLRRQHSELMSPIVWDLAHIANFEEQWVSRASPAHASDDHGRAARDALYEATRHPRAARGGLVLPGRDACLAYLAKVRTRTRAAVRTADVASSDPLLVWAIFPVLHVSHGAGFAYGLARYLRRPDWSPPERLAPRAQPAASAPLTRLAG